MKAKNRYTLTKDYTTKDNLNRLIKTVTDNAKEDRQQALQLFAETQARLGNAETNMVYAELMKSAVATLKQVQDINNTLLKTMSVIQSHISKGNNKKTTDEPMDLFAGLSKLSGVNNGSKEEDDDES